MRVFVGVTALVAAMCLSVVPAHAAPPAPAATAFAEVASPGPLPVGSTTTVTRCVGDGVARQERDARRDRVFAPLECTGAYPIGKGSGVGVNFYHPLTGSAYPLIVFSGGYGANPGYFDRLARHWASHGYVVAVSYEAGELVPSSTFRGIRRAIAVNADVRSPLHRMIDLRSVIIAGHSFGATNVLHAADLIGLQGRGTPVPPEFRLPRQVRVVGVLAIGPAVGTVTNAVSTPTLVVSGTDDVVAPPREIRRSYDGIVDGPAWWAVLNRGTHLMTLGPVAQNSQAGIETAFLDFVTRRAFCREFAGPGWPGDRAVVDAARNARVRALGCGR